MIQDYTMVFHKIYLWYARSVISRETYCFEVVLSPARKREIHYHLCFENFIRVQSTKLLSSLYVLEHLNIEEEHVLHLTLVLEDWKH